MRTFQSISLAMLIKLVAFALFSFVFPLSFLKCLKAAKMPANVLLNLDARSLIAFACSFSLTAISEALRTDSFSRAAVSSTSVKLRLRNSSIISRASFRESAELTSPPDPAPDELFASANVSV